MQVPLFMAERQRQQNRMHTGIRCDFVVVLLRLGPRAPPTLQQKSSHAHIWIQPSPFLTFPAGAGHAAVIAPTELFRHQTILVGDSEPQSHTALTRHQS